MSTPETAEALAQTVGMNCRSCGARIIFGITTANARIPLNAAPSQLGKMWRRPDGTFAQLTDEQHKRAVEKGEILYMPHHATCPQSASYKGPQVEQMGLGL